VWAIHTAVNRSENHHGGRHYDGGLAFARRLANSATRWQRAQPTLSANILFMFQAMVTRLHSLRTWSSPCSSGRAAVSEPAGKPGTTCGGYLGQRNKLPGRGGETLLGAAVSILNDQYILTRESYSRINYG